MKSLECKIIRVHEAVGDFLYENIETQGPEIGKLWDFYDLFPGWYNRVKNGKVSLQVKMKDLVAQIESEINTAEAILDNLTAV